jgi:ATP-dependent helicase/nuclease subunit A
MSAMSEQPGLFDDLPVVRQPLPDQPARDFAVDPAHHVVLEASAGTGKTTVLVHRYLNLLRQGADPSNILAITFTRKAAAEMRERIIRELKRSAALSPVEHARWSLLRDRLSDIAISTIDAFCLSLLREFPLEVDLDPGFSLADETEVPRLMDEALDRALRISLVRAREDEDLALVLAQLGIARARRGLAHLLARRLVAWGALHRFLAQGPDDLRVAEVCRRSLVRLSDALRTLPGGLERFLADGPVRHPRFRVLAHDLRHLDDLDGAEPAIIRGVTERVRHHFLTLDGTPRKTGGLRPYHTSLCESPAAWRRHRAAIAAASPLVADALKAFARDLNLVLARGVRKAFAIALNEYRRTLKERALLDFSDVLEQAVALLRQMDEFAQSRYRLEARYQHVLVDEFQDTSRAQWELVSLLIQSWGQGSGAAHEGRLPPSVFVVGDRKQSIYRFRDAEVAVLQEASEYIQALNPAAPSPRRSIAFSFRAAPPLLAFVNDLFEAVRKAPDRPDAFVFSQTDRFPPTEEPAADRNGPSLGLVAADTPEASAAAVAEEIARLLGTRVVRDRDSGERRTARPGDLAILFRSRASHREFEQALEARGIPAYVYKGLGFFDAEETKDLTALLRYLADPSSNVRAAAFLRSRVVHLSDTALCRLAPRIASAITSPEAPAAALEPGDQSRLARARAAVPGWLRLADQIPPADLLEFVLSETAYDFELRGPRRAQARENVKKMRSLIRRIQNRGYPTLRRIAEHLDSVSAGDESNAALEAVDAVNLMTVHAAKGLEFPIVFVVNMAKGASGPPAPVRVSVEGVEGDPSVSVASYVSDADEDEGVREEEETKRLLYVALTRARDALYLGTVLKDGEMRPGRGSLGSVLPPTVQALFGQSARAGDGLVEWQTESGRAHHFRAVPPAEQDLAPDAASRVEPATPGQDFSVRAASADTPRMPVTTYASGGDLQASPGEQPRAPAGDVIAGSLVHRLFQARVPPGDRDELGRRALLLLRPEERAQLDDPDAVVTQAATVYVALAGRSEVAEILASGVCEYEVPFSLSVAPTSPGAAGLPERVILRGTIDCLVRRTDGSVLILEFKTGRRQPEHQRQLELYLTAARALFPGAVVSGLVAYPEQ